MKLAKTGSEVGHRTLQEAEDKADEMGLECFTSYADEIFLDIDKQCVINWDAQSRLQENGITFRPLTLLTSSKSGNEHFYFKLEVPLTITERLCVQAILGSDPIKEALSLIRHMNSSEAPICLFETATESERVRQWRDKFK